MLWTNYGIGRNQAGWLMQFNGANRAFRRKTAAEARTQPKGEPKGWTKKQADHAKRIRKIQQASRRQQRKLH